MRTSRKLLRLLLCCVLLVAAGSASQSQTPAQPGPPLAGADDNKVDARAYAALFRRVLLFEKMAAEADKAGTPKPHLRRNLQTRFQLSDDDNASLLRYAQAWDSDRAPLLKRKDQLRQQFSNTYPGGVIPRGVHPSPPAETKVIQSEMNALTLHYRDLLRNAMRPAAYDDLENKIRKSFGVEVSQPHKEDAQTQGVAQ